MAWWNFCLRMCDAYRERGEYTAAMVYWSMRFWAMVFSEDGNEALKLTTEEGFEEEIGVYFEHKLEQVPDYFD